MTELLNIEPWWRFGVALLIGALIGLEREFVQQRAGTLDFAGIRTFSLMALLGAVSAFLAEERGLWFFLVTYVGLILLVSASYFGGVVRGTNGGMTTEVAALLVPLFGAMVVWGRAELAAALGVITALLLALKPSLHGVARRMSSEDLRATLEFALIAAVVLPLLPNRTFGPFNVLNPFAIWLLVVFVSGISFLGYVLMKVLGAERGIGLTGVLGGTVSSTATTVSFATRSKEHPPLSASFGRAIILASSVMFPRVLVEVLVVHPPLLSFVLVPVGAMLLTGLALVTIFWRRQRSRESAEHESVQVGNPLKLSIAITFALLFAAVLIVVKAAQSFFGTTGVYVASAISGLTGVDAITLSAAELVSLGQMDSEVAAVAIILAVLVNTAAKAVLAYGLGSRALSGMIFRAFGTIILVGIVSTAGTLWLAPSIALAITAGIR